ncbi:YjbF family lipoprotein [Halocynthiibacter styelae]|uniref:YjbF family lipoprotein n=1 Tax=Halocynthiibacter styelae TaxID=2761955 RepID=A0A8J7LQ88_9RHOB|nr:YjbF family lipoprotein [Paenihalocynthiibacter styelae]MBI1494771.1 YjbF family lipoprotein [Paenihalocynthiibacter styelae]
MKKSIQILGALVIMTVGGCSGGGGGSDRGLLPAIAENAGNMFSGGRAEKVNEFNIEQTFGPEQIAAMSAPTLAGHLLTRDVWSGMTLAFSARGYDTYHTSEGIGLSFRSDVVVSTRGIGGDLFASDMSGTIRALAAGGGGQYQKSMRFLTPLSGFRDVSLTCRMRRDNVERFVIAQRSFSARRYTETCTSEGLSVENHYFRNDAGKILRSRQWLGSEGGYIELFRLKG